MPRIAAIPHAAHARRKNPFKERKARLAKFVEKVKHKEISGLEKRTHEEISELRQKIGILKRLV